MFLVYNACHVINVEPHRVVGLFLPRYLRYEVAASPMALNLQTCHLRHVLVKRPGGRLGIPSQDEEFHEVGLVLSFQAPPPASRANEPFVTFHGRFRGHRRATTPQEDEMPPSAHPDR